MQDRNISISVNPGSIAFAILFVLLVWLLFALHGIVLIVLTAIVISSAIEPAVLWFMKYRLPRPISVLAVYGLLLGALFSGVYFFVPPLLEEMRNASALLPQYIDQFEFPTTVQDGAAILTGGGSSAIPFTDTLSELEGAFSNFSEGFFRTVTIVFGGLFSFILIVVLSFYFALQETGVDDFLRVVTPVKYQSYALDLWRRSHIKIGRWMQGQILLSVLIAVLIYLCLLILQFKFPGYEYVLLLAVLAGILELIPVFGSIIAAIPAVLIGFSVGGTTLALIVVAIYLIVNQFQSNLIYPLVVKKIVGVPPLLVLLALIAGGQLAGVLGIIIAVPLAAALQEWLSDIQRKKQRELEKLSTGG